MVTRTGIILNLIRQCSTSRVPGLDDRLIRLATIPQIPNSLTVLRKQLINSVSAHAHGKFLVINKPFGISCVGYQQSNGGIFENSRHDRDLVDEDDENLQKIKVDAPTVSDVLPFLSEAFGEPSLHFCVGLKRNISGPVVLTASKKAFNAIKKSLKTISYHNDEHHRALVICLGRPEKVCGVIAGYSTFQKVRDHQEYIFVETSGKMSKRARCGKFAVQGHMKYEVIASNYGCSLIDISFSKFSRHLPRLMLTQLLCPPMGDPIYSSRVVEIDGYPTLIAPKDLYRSKHAKRNVKPLLERLRLTEAQLQSNLPMYFHVYRSTFPNFERSKVSGNVDLIASATLPDHMMAMLKCLNLKKAALNHLRSLEEQSEYDNVNILSGEKKFSMASSVDS